MAIFMVGPTTCDRGARVPEFTQGLGSDTSPIIQSDSTSAESREQRADKRTKAQTPWDRDSLLGCGVCLSEPWFGHARMKINSLRNGPEAQKRT